MQAVAVLDKHGFHKDGAKDAQHASPMHIDDGTRAQRRYHASIFRWCGSAFRWQYNGNPTSFGDR
ncbi:MAG: hypothetical protein RIS00_264, partial [Pseudomonadota bacterium]